MCRGWCFCESSVSNLIKSFVMVLDLGKFDEESMKDWGAVSNGCRANRAPPLTPSEFRPELATKSFTSKNADEEMVNRLFEEEFNKRMGGVTELIYTDLKWTDKEAVAVSKVIATGVLKKLERLNLGSNQIGDAGVKALAEAAGKGTLPQLKNLYLDRNQIGDAGVTALVEAAGKGSLPQLELLDLRDNQIGDAGVMALAEAAGKGTLPQLKGLYLMNNSTISQQAQDALEAALPDCYVDF